MTIPFLKFLLEKLKGPKPEIVAAPVRPIEKPSSERLSKTVVPNATRAVPASDPFGEAANSNGANGSNGNGRTPFKMISFGSESTRGSHSADLPPALALALEPKVERVVSLQLADIVPQMPDGWVKALNEDDASRRVLLKAAELERGMSNGKPSVSIATIYRQVPEIFLREVDAADPAQVRLPFTKVLEQFTKLQMR